MFAPPYFASALLESPGRIVHGFYGRIGGVSTGSYDSLNCGRFSGDSPAAVAVNRRRVAEGLGGVRPGGVRLFTNKQIHGRRVRIITAGDDPDEIVEGDGLVTREAGLCLGVLTADCAPVLFADPVASVIGAAHAGWRGALLGVTDAVIEKMAELGARPQRIMCAIGPAIQAVSYRIGAEFVGRFRADSPVRCEECFREDAADGNAGGGGNFDLPHYLRKRLVRAKVASLEALAGDTFADEAQFFSCRRSCLRGEANYGRQISAIVLV